ncbi:MAG TPA: C40 family peptidase [Candidatus Coprenecus pullistercoris]|nr:C40 family peptidase [Candidatus Coprenecus pullistercoris]
MKKVLFIILSFVLCSVFAAEARNGMALVSVSVTDMKKAPDYQSETVSQATMGTPVEVTGKQGYWYSIVTPEGYTGWTTELNLALITEERFGQWRASDRLIVTEYFAVVRESPCSSSHVISDCVMGNILELGAPAGNDDGYVPVVLPDGRKGYVRDECVSALDSWMEEAADPSGEDIVSTARLFLGFPYLWGGLSPKGMDCSGLVKLSYFLNGIILLRDASQQIGTGEPIDYSDVAGSLQAGDLVFFGRSASDTRGRSVSHVGICMGDGLMIHSSLRVRINSLLPGRPDSYTSKSIVGAVRVLGHQDTEPGIVTVLGHPWYFNQE